MSAPYTSKSVANAFLAKGVGDGAQIDPMKIQKLVYLAHGYYMAAHPKQTPLINELFEAWQYGPVLPSLYHEFREFGRSPITRPAMEVRLDVAMRTTVAEPKNDQLFDQVRAFVWTTYGRRPAMELSHLTHREGGPWDVTRKGRAGIINADIENEKILQHFSKLVTVPHGKRESASA